MDGAELTLRQSMHGTKEFCQQRLGNWVLEKPRQGVGGWGGGGQSVMLRRSQKPFHQADALQTQLQMIQCWGDWRKR